MKVQRIFTNSKIKKKQIFSNDELTKKALEMKSHFFSNKKKRAIKLIKNSIIPTCDECDINYWERVIYYIKNL